MSGRGSYGWRVERGILSGITGFRWIGWAWVVTVTVGGRDHLRRPWLAVLLVALALAVTVVDTVLLRTRPAALLEPGPIVAELVVGVALVVGDGIVYRSGHTFSSEQSLGVAWPLFGVLSAGLAFGRRWRAVLPVR